MSEGETNVSHTFWKWIAHKVLRLTSVLSNKKVSVKYSVRMRVFVAFHIVNTTTQVYGGFYFTLWISYTT